jgi:hypothetical protein
MHILLAGPCNMQYGCNSLCTNLDVAKKQCIMTNMRYDHMHYEKVYCTLLTWPVTALHCHLHYLFFQLVHVRRVGDDFPPHHALALKLSLKFHVLSVLSQDGFQTHPCLYHRSDCQC